VAIQIFRSILRFAPMTSSSSQSAKPIRLYKMPHSGHCHRVELFMSLLGLSYESIIILPGSGVVRQPWFLELNPFGEVPLIVDGDVTVFDSNSILIYLAKRYGASGWLPDDPRQLAQTQQWLSLAAGPIAFGPCAARRSALFGVDLVPASVSQRISIKLFHQLDREFGKRRFATGDAPTVADVAAYTYIAHAPEGGISLEPYQNLRDWIDRFERLPGFIPMPRKTMNVSA
jgi:glutathione S-transferase